MNGKMNDKKNEKINDKMDDKKNVTMNGNCIISEINIKKEDINKDIRIINSYEQ